MANFRIEDLAQATAFDNQGKKVGDVKDVYINDITGQPDFVSVTSGIFSGSTLVPLRGHSFDGEDVTLAFDKDRIQDDPVTDDDGYLTEHDRETLYRHYGLESAVDHVTYDFGNVAEEAPIETQVTDVCEGVEVVPVGEGSGSEADRLAVDAPELLGEVGSVEEEDDEVVAPASLGDFDGKGSSVGEKDVNGREVIVNDPKGGLIMSSYASDVDAGVSRGEVRDELVLSEEQLRVEKERVEAGEARIQKYVVTEMQTIEVPVTREEVRIVREPITEEDRVKYEGASLGDQETSVVLHEERVVVSKVTVPVERVSLRTETVEETKVVEETVARERLETEGPVTGRVETGQVRGDEGTGLNLSDLDFS